MVSPSTVRTTVPRRSSLSPAGSGQGVGREGASRRRAGPDGEGPAGEGPAGEGPEGEGPEGEGAAGEGARSSDGEMTASSDASARRTTNARPRMVYHPRHTRRIRP